MRKIVITGPESSGKTTLTKALSEALHLPWVKEYARAYLEDLGRDYVPNDLVKIARGQVQKEAEMQAYLTSFDVYSSGNLQLPDEYPENIQFEHFPSSSDNFSPSEEVFLLCDTSLLVLQIWSEYKYHYCADFIKNRLQQQPPDLYLLCAPDIPWEADPQRENPTNREELFALYEAKIKAAKVPYVVLTGNMKQRMKSALSAIRSFLRGNYSTNS